jgi:hypothetical protein
MTVRTLLVGGVVLGLAATGAGSAWAAPPAPAAAKPAPATTAAAAARAVPLITGDIARLSTAAGKPAVAVVARDHHGVAGSFRTVQSNGDTYVLPAAAMPYLGRGLDRALFDVTQLAKAGGDRVPVRLTYRAGAAHRAIPGVTITSTNGSTADGYIDRGGALQFGQALVAQVKADAAAGWPAGAGIFAGLTGFRYAGPTATPPATPKFPMFTLRILATGLDGQPAGFAFVTPVNVDDARKYQSFFAPQIVAGEARISLPAGNYGFNIETFDFSTDQFVDVFVNISDYKLTTAQTLTADFRTATKDVAVDTPRPAVTDDFDLTWMRGDSLGSSFTLSLGEGDNTKALVDPGLPAKVGVLNWSNGFHRVSGDGSYTYDLRFGSEGSIPSNLHYAVTDADLATVEARYHVDPGIVPPQQSDKARFSSLPWFGFAFASSLPVQPGTARTEYVHARPDITWGGDYPAWIGFDFTDDNFFFEFANEFFDPARVYQPRTSLTEEWGKAPVAPGLDTDVLGAGFFNCPACRDGDTLKLNVQLNDSTPGHFEFFDFPQDTPFGPVTATERIQLFAGSTKLADSAEGSGVLQVPVGPDAATYRLVNDTTHIAPWTTLSTATHTEWTFGSAHPNATTAPANWLCGAFEPPTGNCAVLPLLTLRYAAPVDLTNTATGGATHLGLRIAPTQHAPAAAVTSVTADVSFDHGRTWTAATVTGSGTGYDAAFTAPATGTVSTRVTAHDANGGAVTQTITDAYALGGGA